MDLPTPREIDLESLLRERDVQLAELTVSVKSATRRRRVETEFFSLG